MNNHTSSLCFSIRVIWPKCSWIKVSEVEWSSPFSSMNSAFSGPVDLLCMYRIVSLRRSGYLRLSCTEDNPRFDLVCNLTYPRSSCVSIRLCCSTFEPVNCTNTSLTLTDPCWASSSLTRHQIYQIFVVRWKWFNGDRWCLVAMI